MSYIRKLCKEYSYIWCCMKSVATEITMWWLLNFEKNKGVVIVVNSEKLRKNLLKRKGLEIKFWVWELIMRKKSVSILQRSVPRLTINWMCKNVSSF